jgi:alcohol dehydrogenase (NADP+)
VTLFDTWKAMESLMDHGKCRAIGLSDITLDELKPIYESARIKPAVVQLAAAQRSLITERTGWIDA